MTKILIMIMTVSLLGSLSSHARADSRELSSADSHDLFSTLKLVGVEVDSAGGLQVSSVRCFRDLPDGNGIPFSACVINSGTVDVMLVNGADSDDVNFDVSALTLVVNRLGKLIYDTPTHTTSYLKQVVCTDQYNCTIEL